MDNLYPRTGQEGAEGEQRYTPTLFLSSELDGVGGQHNALDALSLGNTRYPLYRNVWAPGLV